MNRRHFLLLTGALATAPAFIRRAFADESLLPLPPGAEPLASLAGAYRRAQRSSKALLVLVIPRDDGHKWDRGAAFGAFLNYGDDDAIAPLDGCEVVCAGMAEVKKLVPSAPDGEPLMVVIDTQRVPATARALDATLPEYPDRFARGADDWKALTAREDRITERRMTLLDALLQPLGVAGDVRARLVKRRIPGSHWANASGCGTNVEDDGDDSMHLACGMGHVPSRSSRFLYLYAQTPGEQRRAAREKK
jgi:hypothetical protein